MMVTPSVRLVRPLGEGGMGSVWVADHTALRTQVVVKFIAAGLKSSKEATERFSREAAAAAQVKSPHVVQTFDHGFTDDGVPYIVMELLEGRDLGIYLDEQGKLAPELVLEIVAQLARALDRAHERGIIHRDIKPGNIFLCDQGKGEVFVKLLDFGIAKGVDVPTLDSGTKTGAMIGSPFYMSPEQILGSKNVDHRSDLWSVGVVAYEALTGKKPFDAETMGGLAIKIHSEPLPLPSKAVAGLPETIDAWFHKACSRTVPDRFNSAKEMAEALAAALGGEMPRSLEMPRISTGSSDVSPSQPTMVAGASTRGFSSTEAGVVRSTAGSKTRNRVLAVVAFGAVVGLGSFVAVSALKKGDTRNTTGYPIVASEPTNAPSAPKLVDPNGTSTNVSNTTAPPPPTTPTLSSTIAATTATQPLPTHKGGTGKHPVKVPASAPTPPATLPSQAPPVPTPPPTKPATSGHDIF